MIRCSLYIWCCVPLGFVVPIDNFFSLVQFSSVIHKRRGIKLISKTVKYNLDSSSEMQFTFFLSKRQSFCFLKNYWFCRKSGNDAKSRGWGWYSSRHCDAMRTKIDIWVSKKGEWVFSGWRWGFFESNLQLLIKYHIR